MDIHRNGSHDLGDQPGACSTYFFSYIFWHSCIYIYDDDIWWYMMIYDYYISHIPPFFHDFHGDMMYVSVVAWHRHSTVPRRWANPTVNLHRKDDDNNCWVAQSWSHRCHIDIPGAERRVWQCMASLSWSMIDDGSWNWSLWISQSMIIHVDIHNGVNGDIHLYQH